MLGYSVRATAASSISHRWIAVMNIDTARSGTKQQLDSAAEITSTSLFGAFFGQSVVAINCKTTSYVGTTSFSYTIPSSTVVNTRHVIGDVVVGCYLVSGSIDNTLAKISVSANDNTLVFYSFSAGLSDHHCYSFVWMC